MPNPIIEQVAHNGAFIVSDIIGGYFVARTYYGYTRREALTAFRREFTTPRNTKGGH